MKKNRKFDLTYLTIDSLTEGVGSSQISPLIFRLSQSGLKINLISFEKSQPKIEVIDYFRGLGVEWNFRQFKSDGLINGIARINELRQEVQGTALIHARSDIPAISGITSNQAPVLWDVRSLWADQKVMIQKNRFNKTIYPFYRSFESIAAASSVGMSTLTHAVVPILEKRHRKLPAKRTVVPTAVDLNHFKLIEKLPKKPVALFSGTYNDYYDLPLSAAFMNEFRTKSDIDIHWARPQESSKSKINVGEIKIFPALQIEMANLIPNYSFGVSICKLNAGPSLTAAMPTKIAEFLACGRPVVINKNLGDMDQFIAEYNAGVILDGSLGNLEEGVSKLRDLLSDPTTPLRCRALAEKYFNMDVGALSYLNLYDQMIN